MGKAVGSFVAVGSTALSSPFGAFVGKLVDEAVAKAVGSFVAVGSTALLSPF